MPAYRLYQIDGTGRFHGSEVVQADSDEHAIELSNHSLAGAAGELWIAERDGLPPRWERSKAPEKGRS